MMNKKNILITGASSGIGRALSIEYAASNIKLFLLARSQNRLQQVASLCIIKGAEVEIIVADVKDSLNIQQIIEKIYNNSYLDIVIVSAGISAGTLGNPEQFKQVQEIFNTNLYGVLNVIEPIIPFMIKNKKRNIVDSGVLEPNGNDQILIFNDTANKKVRHYINSLQPTIVILSSMAGLIGLSSSPSYSASKSAVKIFGDALRSNLKQYGINVCVVIPGYVETPMTAMNDFPMPLKISAEKAAQIIIKGIDKKKGIIAFPYIMYILLKLINLFPYKLIDFINSKLPGKKPLI